MEAEYVDDVKTVESESVHFLAVSSQALSRVFGRRPEGMGFCDRESMDDFTEATY